MQPAFLPLWQSSKLKTENLRRDKTIKITCMRIPFSAGLAEVSGLKGLSKMSETFGANRLKELLLGDETAADESRLGVLTRLGLSVEEFARLSNLTRASVYYYMSGKTKPSRESVIRMAKVLEMEPDELELYVDTREPGRPMGYRRTARY